MAISINKFRQAVIESIRGDRRKALKAREVDRKIAFGVLLWAIGAVAEADGQFREEEERKIKKIILTYLDVSKEDFPIILAASRQAAIEKVNFYKFAHEIDRVISSEAKTAIIENLFRVAYADCDIHESEAKIIKDVAFVFGVGKEKLIEIEANIKRECEDG